MTVLDASALLALVHDEPGADAVAAHLGSGRVSTANLAEVVGQLVDLDLDPRRLEPLLRRPEAHRGARPQRARARS